jgi:hypothetical protein
MQLPQLGSIRIPLLGNCFPNHARIASWDWKTGFRDVILSGGRDSTGGSWPKRAVPRPDYEGLNLSASRC